MLTPVDDLDRTNRALCQTYDWIALDLTNGNFLTRSTNFDNGQNGMYIFHVRNKMTIVIWAGSDLEAVHKANHDS